MRDHIIRFLTNLGDAAVAIQEQRQRRLDWRRSLLLHHAGHGDGAFVTGELPTVRAR